MPRSPRSLTVAPNHIVTVTQALQRSDFSSQQALAEELGMSRTTVINFLTGKKVDRLNFIDICTILNLNWREIIARDEPSSMSPRIDPGDVDGASVFYGRDKDRQQLNQWIINDRCRLVTISGMPGIGKTSLAVKLTKEIADQFEYVILRSLKYAPTVEKIVTDLINFLPTPENANVPEDLPGRIQVLIDCLRRHRCLVVLDNAESILQVGDKRGQYKPGYADYSQLLTRAGEADHKSCFILTSQEIPTDLSVRVSENSPVRSYTLTGLNQEAGEEILRKRSCFCLPDAEPDWRRIIEYFVGNPKALEIAGTYINDVNDGNISEFLEYRDRYGSSLPLGEHIVKLLEACFVQLSSTQKQIMYWLAIERESVSLQKLQDNFPSFTQPELRREIKDLRRRSLIERDWRGDSQPDLVLNYMTKRITSKVCEEIITGNLEILKKFSLITAQAQEYVRDEQIRFIWNEVKEKMLQELGNHKNFEIRLHELVFNQQETGFEISNFLGGNILNFLIQLNTNLSEHDFSNLTILQAHLQDIKLHNTNFKNSDLSNCTFSKVLSCIHSVAFSPNEEFFATSEADGNIRLWQTTDNKQLRIFEKKHRTQVWSISFSPDEKTLASGGEDKTVNLWDVNTGQCFYTSMTHTRCVRSVAFSPDGKILASAGDDCIVLLDITTRQNFKTLPATQIHSIAFSSDGFTLASGSENGTVCLWNINTGECIRTWQEHTNSVHSVAFSSDKVTVASGSKDGTVRLWNLNTNNSQDFQAQMNQVRTVAVSPDGKTLASGSDDYNVRLWDIFTGQCQVPLKGHKKRVRAVAFSPDGKTLVSGSDDRSIKLWDVSTGKCRKTLQGYRNRVWSVTFSPEGDILASGSEDNTIRFWNVRTGECIQTFSEHTNWVWSVAFSPNGELLASSSEDNTIRLWNVRTGQCRKILAGHKDRVRLITFSPDGQTLASGSSDCNVKLWNVNTGNCFQTLTQHQERVLSVIFSSNGQTLASSSRDKTVCLWNLDSGEVRTLRGHQDQVHSLAFSPDGAILVSGSFDGTLKFWDVNTAECVNTVSAHNDQILSVAFSPNGQTLASGSHDETVKLWDANTHQCFNILTKHKGVVESVSFSPDSKTLASGSQDETIRFWDVRTGELLNTLVADKPYKGMNITGVTGLTDAQKATLKALGAVSDED